MIRKIIAWILFLTAGLLLAMILSNGLFLPHVLGPTTLAAIGAILFAWPQKVK